MKLTMTTR